MPATGLSDDPQVYRVRLEQQSDEQVDAWAAELLRDIAIRRGVIRAIEAFRNATGLDEPGIERVFASGGGAPDVVGRDAQGRLMMPAIMLHFFVPGTRSQVPGARDRLIDFLVESYEEFVFV